jgi:hypothetical protein
MDVLWELLFWFCFGNALIVFAMWPLIKVPHGLYRERGLREFARFARFSSVAMKPMVMGPWALQSIVDQALTSSSWFFVGFDGDTNTWYAMMGDGRFVAGRTGKRGDIVWYIVSGEEVVTAKITSIAWTSGQMKKFRRVGNDQSEIGVIALARSRANPRNGL